MAQVLRTDRKSCDDEMIARITIHTWLRGMNIRLVGYSTTQTDLEGVVGWLVAWLGGCHSESSESGRVFMRKLWSYFLSARMELGSLGFHSAPIQVDLDFLLNLGRTNISFWVWINRLSPSKCNNWIHLVILATLGIEESIWGENEERGKHEMRSWGKG